MRSKTKAKWEIDEEGMLIHTPWGMVYVQSESELCAKTRFHFPEWHRTATPPFHIRNSTPGDSSHKRAAWAKLKAWAKTTAAHRDAPAKESR